MSIYRNDQERQLYKVLGYIDKNLTEPLPLDKLAQVSTYSAFHFQRIFSEMMGESPTGYVKRLRLENAAHMLIYEHHIPITDVAISCGFSSLSYFTYSFTKNFGTSPKKWREGTYRELFPREYYDSKKSKTVSKFMKEVTDDFLYNEFRWLDLTKVEVIEFPVCATVNSLHIGPYTQKIPAVWEELYQWCNARGFIGKDTLLYGVPRNNPFITPPSKSHYECRIEVADQSLLSQEEICVFNGGKHVVYPFPEPVDYCERSYLIDCYSELYSYWLPRSGYRYLGNPIELVQMETVQGSLSMNCKIKAIALAIEPK